MPPTLQELNDILRRYQPVEDPERREDAVSKWAREADEQAAQLAAANRSNTITDSQLQRWRRHFESELARMQIEITAATNAAIAAAVEAAIKAEHEFLIEIVAGAIAETRKAIKAETAAAIRKALVDVKPTIDKLKAAVARQEAIEGGDVIELPNPLLVRKQAAGG
jgi:hypothetical protein